LRSRSIPAHDAADVWKTAFCGAGTATGTVKWFSLQKGFGFNVNAATGKDVFVHISAVEKAELTKLNEGQQVDFVLENNRGKATAVNLKVK
jgi:CspA family cold shock protein